MFFRVAQMSLVLFLCSCALAQDNEPTLEGALATITRVADNFPVNPLPEERRRDAVAALRWAEGGLLASLEAKSAPAASLHLILGDLHRMGHNLDLDGSNDQAKFHLGKAIELDPANPKPYLILGRHLTFSGAFAEGERNLLQAVALTAPEKLVDLHYLLANNYYFQKRYVLALAMASRIPANHPASRALEVIRTSAQKAIETGKPHGEVVIEQ